MVEYNNPVQSSRVGFDARLHWNEILGHCLEDIRINRIMGNYQAWFNALCTLYDMGQTYLEVEDTKKINEQLIEVQKAIWRYDSLGKLQDKKMQHNKKIFGFKIQMLLSEIQVIILRKMGEKGMFLPIKVPLSEFSELDLRDGMGL